MSPAPTRHPGPIVPEDIAGDTAAVEDFLTSNSDAWYDQFDPIACVNVSDDTRISDLVIERRAS
ncbi:hypothetical protein [Nonomuraea sp. NPDC049400]|uniref:hypothetical protein n=1 Tax=Nonomuraea sp. NPDC049400 TaxID=3364352 RepID=UPI00378FB35D